MRARENICQISQNATLPMKFFEFYLFFHMYSSCEIISIAVGKRLKRIRYCINYSGTRFLRARENICQISQNATLPMKFFEFYLFFHMYSSCEIISIAVGKRLKRIRYCINYSGTRFLSTENWNYSNYWWFRLNVFCKIPFMNLILACFPQRPFYNRSRNIWDT